MHALRRHQVATFTKEFTRELKIVIAETTVSVIMQNQVASDANEPMQEKLFMKRHSEDSSMESPMAEHGKKKVNIFSCWTCLEE